MPVVTSKGSGLRRRDQVAQLYGHNEHAMRKQSTLNGNIQRGKPTSYQTGDNKNIVLV